MVRRLLFSVCGLLWAAKGWSAAPLHQGAGIERTLLPKAVAVFQVTDSLGGYAVITPERGSVDVVLETSAGAVTRLPATMEGPTWAWLPASPATINISPHAELESLSFRIERYAGRVDLPRESDPIWITTQAAAVDLYNSSERGKAIRLNEAAIAAWPEGELNELKLHTYLRLADLLRRQSRFADALDVVLEAKRAYSASNWSAWLAIHAGMLRMLIDDVERAEEDFCHALTMLSGDAGCSREEMAAANFQRADWASNAMTRLGEIHHGQGELQAARGWYQLAAARAPSWASIQRAVITNNLGGVEFMRGNFGPALTRFEEALGIYRTINEIHEIETALGNIASTHLLVGDHDTAIQTLVEIAELQEREQNLADSSLTLHRLGILYLELGNHAEAERYLFRGLNLKRDLGLSGVEQSQLQIGRLRREQGDIEGAVRFHREAYMGFEKLGEIPGQAQTLVELALDDVAAGDLQSAARRAEESAKLLEVLEDGRLSGRVLNLSGYLHRRAGRFVDALRDLEAALDLNRRTADHVGEIRTLFEIALANKESGHPEEAMRALEAAESVVERSRLGVSSRDLRASFTGGYMDIYGEHIALLIELGSPIDALGVALNNKSRVLLEAVVYESAGEPAADSRRAKASRLKSELAAKSEARARSLRRGWSTARVEQEISDVLLELDALESQTLSGGAAQLPQIRVQPMQSALADEELLINLWVGAQRSWAWRVTNHDVEVYTIPSGPELETLLARSRSSIKSRGDDGLKELGLALFGNGSFTGVERVYIVPDGVTAMAPFPAIPLPGADEPMIMTVEVSVLPLPGRLLQSEAPMRTAARAAVVSDPVFGSDDPRATNTTVRSEYPRLQATSIEGRIIKDMLETAGYNTIELTGYAASKTNLLNLDDIDVFHLGTHGLVDYARPQLSGLMLSLVSSDGRPTTGLLSLSEIYDLELDAELVVLSACDTAVGTEVGGEGPLSLARGFLIGGARQVVASLWQVPDRATAELMEVFYEGWTNGLTVAQALRAAQLNLARSGRWRSPLYWSAFVVVGV